MRVVAVVPTRDRPHTLQRALATFLSSCEKAGLDVAAVAIGSAASSPTVRARTRDAVRRIAAEHPAVCFCLGELSGRSARSPGAARNRALGELAKDGSEHEAVVFFDDDVSFADCVYQGRQFTSRGTALLREIAGEVPASRTVVGCAYRGRQDLSLLEHLELYDGTSTGPEPSYERAHIAHVAPGGLSGAFLFVPAEAAQLPRFLSGYNEDYFWLRRLTRDGWGLRRSPSSIIHAPPERLRISAPRLKFEMRGEALWCASQGIPRRPRRAELLDRLRHSLAGRIGELALVEHRLRRGGCRFETTRSIIREGEVDLHRHLRAIEHSSVTPGRLPPLAAELGRVAAYCGQ